MPELPRDFLAKSIRTSRDAFPWSKGLHKGELKSPFARKLVAKHQSWIQGQRKPLFHGSREREVSWSCCNAETLHSASNTSMVAMADQSLSKNAANLCLRLGIPWGCQRGMGNPPSRWAWCLRTRSGSTTHTLRSAKTAVSLPFRLCPQD